MPFPERNNAIRVAIVLWSGRLGGAETFAAELGRGLREAGVDARIVFATTSEQLGQRLDEWSVPHRAFGAGRGRGIAYRPRSFAALLREEGQDAALLCSPGWLAAATRAGGYRGKIIGIEHGDLTGFGLGGGTFVRRARKSLRGQMEWRLGSRATDAIVAVSEAVRQRILDRPAARSEVTRIYCGVDLRLYDLQNEPSGDAARRVVAISRLYPGKGLDLLVHAMAHLRKLDLVAEIWGEGAERENLQKLIESLGLEGAVQLRGLALKPEEVWRRAKIAVVPSSDFLESFGRTAAEAMASRKPVIATRNGGLTEIVENGRTGVLVSPHSSTELAEAIAAYMQDPRLAREHGEAGRRRCESQFDLVDSVAAYRELLGRLV